MRLKDIARHFVPTRYRLPISYYREKFSNMLEPEMALFPVLKGDGLRAIDVGTNHGLYTYALSRLFKSVDAFEPVPVLCETKRSMCAQHNIIQCRTLRLKWQYAH